MHIFLTSTRTPALHAANSAFPVARTPGDLRDFRIHGQIFLSNATAADEARRHDSAPTTVVVGALGERPNGSRLGPYGVGVAVLVAVRETSTPADLSPTTKMPPLRKPMIELA
jgi:hypothetical protein